MESRENGEVVQGAEVAQAIGADELEQVAGGGASAFFRYTVVRGDTLYRLAKRFGTTVDTLVRINGIENRNLIRVGQALKIPYKG